MKFRCTKCKKWKMGIEYYKHISNASGYDHRCKECSKAYQRERLYKKYWENPEQERARKRRDYWKHKTKKDTT